ncbi:hypothetical protein J3458_013422 [Metarhizium acridum]|uniref:uncharacterized protein n=1 Tax=Metarhizium acridum TaxID=92637 RepID=UPI001C6B62BF|nr:hypothetical protein J3458_013422 [Metarhizium acridum]
MSNDVGCRQCTCSANFPTNDALEAHIQEYRSREPYLRNELARCQNHAISCENDDLEENCGEREEAERAGRRKPRDCPDTSCDRHSQSFTTRQRLRRHYQTHIGCDEICVLCGKRFTTVSAYIQHIDKHEPIPNDRKRVYVEESRNELLRITESELVRAERLFHNNKKRSLEAAGFEPGTIETCRNSSNLSGLDAPLQDVSSTTAAQLTAPLIQQHDIALIDTNSDSVLTDIGYNASINSWLNFPPMDDQGTGYPEYGTSLVDSSYQSVAPQLL